jgi:hypothetical protein
VWAVRDKTWRIDTVVAVAWRIVCDDRKRWIKGVTAERVYEAFHNGSFPELRESDVIKAREILEDLADRDRLTESDKALRAFLTDCGRRGGVRLADVPRVAVAAAYGLNGMGKRYPRRDAWESYAGSQWQGIPGHYWTPAKPIAITITYTHDLKPRQGIKAGGIPYRYLGRLYRGVDNEGNVYKWRERQRSRAEWHDLTKGDRVTFNGGMVDMHDHFTSTKGVTVRITEFTENGVSLDTPWYDARTA